jgi:hypothetical protein
VPAADHSRSASCDADAVRYCACDLRPAHRGGESEISMSSPQDHSSREGCTGEDGGTDVSFSSMRGLQAVLQKGDLGTSH